VPSSARPRYVNLHSQDKRACSQLLVLQATWTAVTATFVIPTPSAPSGQSTAYASAWVGIDGDTCGSAILQTGVDFNVESGKVSYDGARRADFCYRR
jgi:hypothetical protein